MNSIMNGVTWVNNWYVYSCVTLGMESHEYVNMGVDDCDLWWWLKVWINKVMKYEELWDLMKKCKGLIHDALLCNSQRGSVESLDRASSRWVERANRMQPETSCSSLDQTVRPSEPLFWVERSLWYS